MKARFIVKSKHGLTVYCGNCHTTAIAAIASEPGCEAYGLISAEGDINKQHISVEWSHKAGGWLVKSSLDRFA